MRLFGYYALHSFVNQLRKLFKTWVLIFFAACVVFGGLIGVGASILSDAADDAAEQDIAAEEEIGDWEDGDVLELELGAGTLSEWLGISGMQLVELIAGAVILLFLLIDVLGADKNGSRIFLPADVNLLFASPLKPQSVLLFRLATQLGLSLFVSAYLLGQIPNLLNFGLTVWAALAVILTWGLTIAVGRLLQMLLYTVLSTRQALKSRIRVAVAALLAAAAAGYYAYWKQSGLAAAPAAAAFFAGRASRFVPLWGWLKGFAMFAVEGNTAGSLACLGALVAGGALLAWVIWHVKADFYEDAMAKSEETAELLDRARSEKSGVSIVRRKKDRGDRVRRDGMRHGAGANMFFFKAMYNRFRFAHLGFLTKTMEIYLLIGIGVSAVCRVMIETGSPIPAALALSVFAFFRALGNPLAKDTEMDFFLLIPESTKKKLWFSLLGGTAGCVLDVIPAMIAAALILGPEGLSIFAWLPFVASVDLYATTVGAFIDLSVPVSAGKTIKSIVQVMFVYFGLLPDTAVMAVGIVFGFLGAAAVLAAGINAGIGMLFFLFSSLFLEPHGGSARPAAYTDAGRGGRS